MNNVRPSTATHSSSATSISVVEKIKGWRPRFFLLMAFIITASSVTVGVLGWRLTLNAAKLNISDIVKQLEDVVSDRISAYVIEESVRLRDYVGLQKQLFQTNQFSASTPEKWNKTMRGMLSLLDNNRETSVDAFFVMFPAGELSGYTYNATGSLQMWNQHGLTISTYDCDVNGYPLGAPIRIFTDVGAGTPQEPGNNLTLLHGFGGPSAANLNYSNPNAAGASIIRPVMGRIFKTNVAVAVNEVTKEKVIVGADMSMMFLSRQLDEIAKDISAPLFIGVIGANSGRLLASSPKMELLNEDKTRMLDARELQSPHICDFVGYLNETYGSQLGFIPQMNRLADELNAIQIDGGSRFAERNVGGVDWIMKIKSMPYGGKTLILLSYMDVEAFQKQVQETSDRTGLAMLGIIVAFVILGCLFALVITRQLGLVAIQIDLLKNLKFSEVLDKESGVKNRSFVLELAKLQEAFHEMVAVFAKSLKTSHSLQKGPQTYVAGSANSVQPSQPGSGGINADRNTSAISPMNRTL